MSQIRKRISPKKRNTVHIILTYQSKLAHHQNPKYNTFPNWGIIVGITFIKFQNHPRSHHLQQLHHIPCPSTSSLVIHLCHTAHLIHYLHLDNQLLATRDNCQSLSNTAQLPRLRRQGNIWYMVSAPRRSPSNREP